MTDRKKDILAQGSNTRETLSTNPHHQGSVPTGIGLHRWDVTPREAVALQRVFASRIILNSSKGEYRLIAGCDVSVRKGRVRAAIVVWDGNAREVVDSVVHEDAAVFPYVPGLLSFREVPALIPAMARLKVEPDLLMMDGQGHAHPRRMGLACHAGLWFDLPSVGVAKTRLTGTFQEPHESKGSRSPLMDKDELIGWVVRTRSNVKPLFVSPGHRMGFEEAVAVTLTCSERYRLPEPTRLAHLLSKNGVL